jgi:hypothetical protein
MADEQVVIPPVADTGGTGDAWHKGADAETLGFLQQRGWDSKPANEAAFEAIKSYREAAKHIGAPPEQILRMPKDAADEAGWAALRSRLGVPSSVEGYDLASVAKRADGTEVSADLLAFARSAALASNLPATDAARFATELIKFEDGRTNAASAEKTAKLAEATAALKANWSTNYEANLFIAKGAAAALGATPEQVAALEGVVGYDKVMEMFRLVGTKIGEDKFVNSLNSNLPGVMTVEQASSQKSELMADKAWVDSYLAGDAAKIRQMTALNTIIVG